jgi:hypothetical protein
MGQMGNRPLKPPGAPDLMYIRLMKKNEIGMEVIKVYAVIGGIDYEGENFDSLKIFMSESSALDYKIELEEEERFDYVSIEVKEVGV